MFYNMSQRIYLYLCFCGSVYFYVLCICRLRVYNNIWLKSSENEGYLKCLNLYFGGALHFLYLTRLNSTDRSGADNLRLTPYWRDLSKKRITLWDTCLNFPWYPGNAPIYDVVAATTTLVRLLCASYIVGYCECWFVCLYCCNNKKMVYHSVSSCLRAIQKAFDDHCGCAADSPSPPRFTTPVMS